MIEKIFAVLFDRSTFFTELILEHLLICSIAIFLVLIIGTSLGILMTRIKILELIVLPITGLIYTIPSIALFGLLVSITGIGNKSAIIALVIYGLLPMIRNVYVGIRQVDKDIIEASEAMGAKANEILLYVQLPLALPVIFAGFRTMVVMTIALGAIGAFIGAGGLGVAIYRGITTYNMEMLISGSIIVALMAMLVDFLLGLIEKRITVKYSI